MENRRNYLPNPMKQTIYSIVFVNLGILIPANADINDICIPQIGGLVSEPKMDGIPEDDVGWNGAGLLGIRENITTTSGSSASSERSGNVQYGVKNNYLFISVDSDAFTLGSLCPDTNDPNAKCLGVDNTLVIGMSTDCGSTSGCANDWRLHINPFESVQTGTGIPVFNTSKPREVSFWRDSSKWNLPKPTGTSCNHDYYSCKSVLPLANNSSTAPPPGTVVNSSSGTCNPLQGGQFVVSRNGSRWGLEIKLPITTNVAQSSENCKVYLPNTTNSTFRLYVNLVSTNDLVIPARYVEDPWPFGAKLVDSSGLGLGFIETSTPVISSWGVASLGSRSACVGVSILQAGVRQSSSGSLGSTSSAIAGAIDTDGSYFYTDAGGNKLKNAAACDSSLTNGYMWDSAKSVDNYFVAKASKTGSGTSEVAAKFYIADWGLPGADDWDLIGERYKPTISTGATIDRPNLFFSTPQTVGASSVELQSIWPLSYKESCAYSLSHVVGYSAGKPIGHHCVQAELFATGSDPQTNFLKKSLQFNHNVVPASRVGHIATVGTKGYGDPPAGQANHKIFLELDKDVQEYVKDGDIFIPKLGAKKAYPMRHIDSRESNMRRGGAIPAALVPKGVTEALSVVARGYLARSDKLVIGGKEYLKAEYLGNFSIDAAHNGNVNDWSVTLEPVNCTEGVAAKDCMGSLGGGGYALNIPKDKSLQLLMTIEAHEPKYAIWLALGTTFPHDNFANNYDSGFAGNIGFEYALYSNLAMEIIAGQHQFKGKGSMENIDLSQVSINSKWYFPYQLYRLFATAGLGSYIFDSDTTPAGLNVGGGLQYDIAPRWSVEGRYTVHSIFNNSPNELYSTILAGVRYSF